MGGAFAVLMLTTIFAWMVSCLPFHALLTVLWPRIPWLLRFLLGVIIAAVAVVLLWWVSIEYRTGWIFAAYTVLMVIATVVSVVLLIVRWFMRRS
ncbi:MAG: hypothetical protein IPP26_07450 [Flavobacteriales bacterium]|nr:hypothetical protein [Flavobacteriales bacterium]